MKRWVKQLLIVLVVIALAAACAAWYFGRGSSSESKFRTVAVKRGDLLVTIGATGTVEPEEVIDVGAQVAGQIAAFGKDKAGKSVDYGSFIDQDMVLAEIDPTVYQADVTQAQAQLVNANAGVQRAQADLIVSQAKLEQARLGTCTEPRSIRCTRAGEL